MTTRERTIIVTKQSLSLKMSCNDLSGLAEQRQTKMDRIGGKIMVLAAFIAVMLLVFQMQLFSLVFKYHYAATDISTTRITWIFSVFNFSWHIASILSGPLCEILGYQKVAGAAALTSAMSLISTGLYSNANYLFLSCSIFAGFGGGTLFSVCQYIIPLYFTNRLGLAVGIMNSGISFGRFVFPVLIEYLQSMYGIYAVYIMGAIQLNAVACAMLFRPPRRARQSSRSQDAETPNRIKAVIVKVANNAALIRLPKVFIITFSMALLYVGMSNFNLLIPLALEERDNISENLVTWCFSVTAVTNFIARVVVPAASDYIPVSKMWYVLGGSLLMAISQIVFTLVQSEMAILCAMGAYGISLGLTTGLQTLVIVDVMGTDMLPAVWGANSCLLAMSYVTIGPTIGFVRDVTHNYTICIWYMSALASMSAVLCGLMPCVLLGERQGYLPAMQQVPTLP